MKESTSLQAISAGQASIDEAAVALESALRENVDGIYGALRDWTWKAIHSRRLDDKLTDWLSLIDGVRARLPASQGRVREELGVLSDLLGTSVRFAASVSDEDLLRYNHVPEILRFVAGRNGRVSRQALRSEFTFGDARLSQLLTLLVHGGLLDREPRGREASFSLTSKGIDLVERIRERAASTTSRFPIARVAGRRRLKIAPTRIRAIHAPMSPSAQEDLFAEPTTLKPSHAREDTFVPQTKLVELAERASGQAYHPLIGPVVKEHQLEGI